MIKVYPTRAEKEEAAKSDNPNLYLDAMLKRFKKKVTEAEIILDCKKHDYFLSKSLRRKEKSKRARIKAIRGK